MKIIDKIYQELKDVFVKLELDAEKAQVGISNKPELCDYQCNACFMLAKSKGMIPVKLAELVANAYNQNQDRSAEASFCAPGFVNFVVNDKAFCEVASAMLEDERAGVVAKKKEKIILDFGGANVAKPLHVGHLRSAVIGESVKRIARFLGDEVVGDAHLGDWGLQMGLVIAQMMDEVDCSYYFDGDGEKPQISMENLNVWYPKASARQKEDEDFKNRAKMITAKLQNKEKGYFELYQDIKTVSIQSVDKEYRDLNVYFDLFYGESNAEPYIKPMLELLEDKKLTKESQGATIVEVKRESDKAPMPPVIVKSSAGSDLYATTEIATILMRIKEFNPDQIWYVTDDRQSLHFEQVFRVAELCGFCDNGLKLLHFPFGTVNGKDGKPFKTRQGGTMKLGELCQMITLKAQEKIKESNAQGDDALAKEIGIGALKFGDLINFRAKDYVFDIDKFISFDGKTGPYIQYCAVRIKSILKKCDKPASDVVCGELGALEKKILLECFNFETAVLNAYQEKAPNYIAQNLYDICQAFSTFYNSTKIISEQNEAKKSNYLNICKLVLKILTIGLGLLAIDVPEKM